MSGVQHRTPEGSGADPGDFDHPSHGYGPKRPAAREPAPSGGGKDGWVLYGASGFTGRLLAREAVRRGHRPILAGRNGKRLEPLARELQLEAREVSLGDPSELLALLDPAPLVLHAAGPFVHTAQPMLEACLRTGTPYLDITGEVPVFERVFALDDIARSQGVPLLPGVGFDVVPTDCLAIHLHRRLPDARSLELAFRSPGGPSAGTARTMLEHVPGGVLARRNGELVKLPTGGGSRTVPFHDRPARCVPITWGDLVTAHRSTGIPDITTLTAVGLSPAALRVVGPLAGLLLRLAPLRRTAQALVARRLREGPRRASHDRAALWGRAVNAAGESVELRLETQEGYRFTAAAGLLAVEEVLAAVSQGHRNGDVRLSGTLTPGMAFGPEFVDRVPGTRWPDEPEATEEG